MEAIVDTEDYRIFRGKCKEMTDALAQSDPSLTIVRGFYYCPIWNTEEPHWWCKKPTGEIVDPTARQFPSKGLGIYTEFDGVCSCDECGKEFPESEGRQDSRYIFCSSECNARFVGIF